MTTRTSLPLFGQALRTALGSLPEQLAAPDQIRLEAILSHATTEQIVLQTAVDAAFPGHAKPLPVFNNFVRRVNELAEEQGNAVRFHRDTKKRNDISSRHCWFTGPDPVIASVTEYNAAATQEAEGTVYVPSQGVVTTSGAEETGKRIVRFFVSYAHGEGDQNESKLADDLIKFLRQHFAISKNYELELWTDRKIPLGTDWFDSIQQAISECDFGLLLVSPAFLGSEFIVTHELAHFVASESDSSRKPVLPVGLIEFAFSQDVKGLQKEQIYLGPNFSSTQAKPVFYDSIRGNPKKNKYALDLFQRIEERLDAWFAAQESSQAAPVELQTRTAKECAHPSMDD